MFFLTCFVSAAAQEKTDTVAYVGKLNSEGHFTKAKKILSKYYSAHPGNVNIISLLAQTCFYSKDIKESVSLYESALKMEPGNAGLMRDYFILLVKAGELKKASQMIAGYLGSSDENMILTCARFYFYSGEYAKALQLLQKINPSTSNKEAVDLREQILNIVSPYFKIQTFYQSDDQPLRQLNSSVAGGFYKNQYLAPALNYSNLLFFRDKQSLNYSWLKTNNKINFYKQQSFLFLELGGVYGATQNKGALTACAELGKTSLKHLETSLRYDHQPYFFTRNSLNNLLLFNQYSLNLGWNDMSSWNGKITLAANQFLSNNNYIYSIGAWILAPPLKYKGFELRGGYSFNYSTSKTSAFSSRDSLSAIVANYYYDPHITGVYNPYFTPYQQQTHYALLVLNAKLKHRLSFSVNCNIGLYGIAQNPYLYLDKTSDSGVTLARGYAPHRFYPNEFKGVLSYGITKQLTLCAEYLYRKNNFYTSNYFGLKLLKNFWHGSKTI